MESSTMAQALNAGLRDALKEDDSVLVFGEDIGALGGVFRVTDGLTHDFGEQRCFDTPLAEAGIVGFAVGMAMGGFRPVVEMQFDAFAYPAFEQITSHVAKLANRTRGRVRLPMVIRIPYGGGIGGVEHHCDSSEVYYTHTPGLRVVTPATPQDSYSLLRDAIECPDPVVFLEPKSRYWAKETVSFHRDSPGLDRAVVRRSGTDVSLIAYGPTVATALETAEAAVEEGYDVEVIDLRSLAPFDDDGDQRIPLRGRRKTVADKMTLSRREIPEATVWVDADATDLTHIRKAINGRSPEKRVSLLSLIARFTVAALKKFPELNSQVDGGEIVLRGAVHLGVATQTDRGLLVPVIKDADALTARGMSEAITAHADAGRAGTLQPAQLTGSTFTINNYGVFGVDGSAAIINHPEAGILGIGRIIERPWVVDGELAGRFLCPLTLAFDHRVCDGGTAGGFLRFIADCIEAPARALAEI